MFHYSSYWKTWSRVLFLEGGMFVELNLTPIPYSIQTWADNVEPEIIRIHQTVRKPKDIELPDIHGDAWKLMDANLHPDLVERLLRHDYIAELAMVLLEEAHHQDKRGGGIPLATIKEICDA